MLQTLQNVVTWLFSQWNKVPDKEKTRIIKFIVESFDAMLRAFYNSRKAETKA